MGLLGRPLDGYDYLTLGTLILMLVAVMALILFIMGLPGRVAIKRNHPHAESVKIMGWMGFLAVVPWVHAFMWAFHDSVTVDLRRFPKEERDTVRKEIARLSGQPEPERQAETQSETRAGSDAPPPPKA